MGEPVPTSGPRVSLGETPLSASAAAGSACGAKASSSESGICADNFTFRLVERGGRYYFQDVRVAPPLANHDEAVVVQRLLEGRALDEIESRELGEAFNGSGRCPELQGIIDHLKEMLGV